MPPSRQSAVAATFLALAAVTAAVLAEVLATVVFAVTLAYVLLPVRAAVARRGASARVAAGVATTLASLVAVAFVLPPAFVLYERRRAVVAVFESLPSAIPITVGETTVSVAVAPLVDAGREAVTGLALTVAAAAPVIVLKVIVLVLLVYGLLYRPAAIRTAATRALPDRYHDVLFALDRRAAETLRAIYVLQAATAAGTFLLGTVTFWLLGYESPIVLGVFSGLLQFVPILGPSVVVVVLAVMDLLAGDVTGAVVVLLVGLVVVGFLPDAVIRTRLAEYTTELPVSLYFVGFVGGVLTVGAVGFVLGPLLVALLVETVVLLSDGVARARARQQAGAEHATDQAGAEHTTDQAGAEHATDGDGSDESE